MRGYFEQGRLNSLLETLYLNFIIFFNNKNLKTLIKSNFFYISYKMFYSSETEFSCYFLSIFLFLCCFLKTILKKSKDFFDFIIKAINSTTNAIQK